MNPVQVYVVAATGRAELLRQFRWNEELYPTEVHQSVPRGLISLVEEDSGTARGVWFSTLADYVVFPGGVRMGEPTAEEVDVARERVAAWLVKGAVNTNIYKSVAKVFLSKHRQARKEPTEFDAICVAASEETASSL